MSTALANLADLVRSYMERAKLNENQLATILGHKSSGYVHNVITDKQPLSLKAIPDWAKALKVAEDSDDYRALESAARLRKATANVSSKPAVIELQKRVAALERLARLFPARLRDMVAKAKKQGVDLPQDFIDDVDALAQLVDRVL